MQEFKYLIIGGGIAGTTAAETIRQKDLEGTIAIINDEPYRLYSRVMLSKQNWFLGKIPSDRIWLKTEDWYKEKKITFLGGHTATSLNKENKTITLSNGQIIKYEKLLIATGGNARKLAVKNADKNGVHYCRTMDQGKAILKASKTAKKAVIIGGGFISFEIAELFKLSNIDVTMIIRRDWYWSPLLGEDGSKIVEKAISDFGIKLIKKAEVQEILGKNHVEGVLFKDGSKIDCDIVVCGIGIVFDNKWLENSGVNTNRGILANEYLETNVQDIWTAGDVAEYKDIILDEYVQLGNWANAREHGRISGLNMVGEKTRYKFVSFYNAQGMGMNIAFIGNIRPTENKITIERSDPESNSYGQLIILKDEIVGGTLVNRAPEVGVISNLVKNDIKIDQKHKELADPNFDLKLLLDNK